jgi:hypothetical protein
MLLRSRVQGVAAGARRRLADTEGPGRTERQRTSCNQTPFCTTATRLRRPSLACEITDAAGCPALSPSHTHRCTTSDHDAQRTEIASHHRATTLPCTLTATFVSCGRVDLALLAPVKLRVEAVDERIGVDAVLHVSGEHGVHTRATSGRRPVAHPHGPRRGCDHDARPPRAAKHPHPLPRAEAVGWTLIHATVRTRRWNRYSHRPSPAGGHARDRVTSPCVNVRVALMLGTPFVPSPT